MKSILFSLIMITATSCSNEVESSSEINQTNFDSSKLTGYGELWNGNTPDDIKNKLPRLFSQNRLAVEKMLACVEGYNIEISFSKRVQSTKDRLITCLTRASAPVVASAYLTPGSQVEAETNFGELWNFNKPINIINPFMDDILVFNELDVGPTEYRALQICFSAKNSESCMKPILDEMVDHVVDNKQTIDVCVLNKKICE